MRNLRQMMYHSFIFEPPLSAEEISSFRDSTDPWESLAYLVHRASEGDFSEMPRIKPLIQASNPCICDLFGFVAARFAGMAGRWDMIGKMAESFRAEPDHVREYVAVMMRFSCNPMFTRQLMELYEAAEGSEVREGIAWAMSWLLEPESGRIGMGARESDKYGDDLDDEEGEMPDFKNMSFEELFAKKRDHAGYREVIRDAVHKMQASGIREGDAVLEGALLDVRGLAMRIANRLASTTDPGDRIAGEMMTLSAMTGAAFSPVLPRPGGINRTDAHAQVEHLLNDPKLNAMIPGRRYFFGHPVPA